MYTSSKFHGVFRSSWTLAACSWTLRGSMFPSWRIPDADSPWSVEAIGVRSYRAGLHCQSLGNSQTEATLCSLESAMPLVQADLCNWRPVLVPKQCFLLVCTHACTHIHSQNGGCILYRGNVFLKFPWWFWYLCCVSPHPLPLDVIFYMPPQSLMPRDSWQAHQTCLDECESWLWAQLRLRLGHPSTPLPCWINIEAGWQSKVTNKETLTKQAVYKG